MKVFKVSFLDQEFAIHYLTDSDEAIRMSEILSKQAWKVGGIDIETYPKEEFKGFKKGGLDPLLSRIRLIQVYDGDKSVYIFDMLKFGSWIGTSFVNLLRCKKWIAHYAVFELGHLYEKGFKDLDISCSMLMSQYITNAEFSPFEPEDTDEDEEPDGMARYRRTDHSLAGAYHRNFGVRLNKEYQTSDWGGELSTEQLLYAAEDAIATYKLGIKLGEKITLYKMEQSYLLTKAAQHVVVDMQLHGFGVDTEKYRSLISEWQADKEKAVLKCHEYFGDINLNSTQQLSKWLEENRLDYLTSWPKNEKSQTYSFSKNKIYDYYKDPAIAALLENKKLEKLLNTYGENFLSGPNGIHPVTGRIHSSFTLGETRTGRMSSRYPNLMQLPRNKAIRDCFIPSSPDRKFVVADFSQVEVRVAGELSQDRAIRNGYARGFDAYKVMAASRLGKKIEDVTKQERQDAKNIVLGFQFGLGGKGYVKYSKISTGLDISEDQGWDAYNTYHSTFSGYSAWMQQQREKTKKLGFCRTPLGRMRKLLEDEVYTKSVNFPVQGGAGEVMILTLVLLRKQLKEFFMNSVICNAIHDEIIVDCAPGEENEVKWRLEKAMTDAFLKIFPHAPVNGLAEAGIGKTWAEAKS